MLSIGIYKVCTVVYIPLSIGATEKGGTTIQRKVGS